MSFPLFKFNTTVQSVSFQTKSTKLATRHTDGRLQILWMAIMEVELWTETLWMVNYGRQIMMVTFMALNENVEMSEKRGFR